MRQPPDLSHKTLIACLRDNYGIVVVTVRYLPIGYDMSAFVYEGTATEGTSYFIKIRAGEFAPAALLVPRLLIEQGIPNILAPLRTQAQALWCTCETYSIVVYPFIRGENAMVAGLTEDQWRTFGTTLRAIHDGGFPAQLPGQVPMETFALPSAALVRRMAEQFPNTPLESPAALELAAFWTENATQIEELLTKTEALGKQLQARQFEYVLCHADIHAANILVSDEGRIYIVDWDGPLLAPRERDLLFVIGSKIARPVEPYEEAWFFEGYGTVEVDTDALSYYRYERAIEDIGEFGKSIFFDTNQNEETKQEEVALFRSFFPL
jgi:spectinomycin phosphotransferase